MTVRLTKKRIIILLVALAMIAGGLIYWHLKRAMPTFDSYAIAASETRMWEAYYQRDPKALHAELRDVLQEQFNLSGWRAALIAASMAEATGNFIRLRNQNPTTAQYEQLVLPGIKKAYRKVKNATGGQWDPDEAARAELAWWVARRTPGEDNPKLVGYKIADLYPILYGQSNPHIEQAGYLRAQAAHVRDTTADWPRVHELLDKSYAALVAGIQIETD